MKLRNFIPIVAIAGLFAIGCSSPVYVQKDDSVDLSNYHTYMWVDTRASETDNARTTAFADISIRNAANAELQKRGWREVSNNPDALVSYDILVERSVEQRSDPVYSRSFTRMYYNPYTRRWGTMYYPSQFLGYQYYDVPVKEGTVTISLIDARNDRPIWQGWTTENMNYAQFTDDELARSVKQIFKKL